MVTESADYVVGVDTHAERHALALIEAGSGLLVLESELPACREGYRRALRLVRRRAPGRRVWAVEGTGCYGAGLARYLAGQGERVLEVDRPVRQGREGRFKSDPLDALRAARSALSGQLACPRAEGEREALRVLLATREQAVATRRAGRNQLRALVVTAPEGLRQRLRGLGKDQLLSSCLRLRPRAGQEPARHATELALRSCARRVAAAHKEADELEREISKLVRSLCPKLLAQQGVGPISAGWLLSAWSHKGRVRSEAAFARLAGAAPIPASSGKTTRHRLDRGGDRKLNRALHTIVLSRRHSDPETKAYISRRLSEGKSSREAVRCLKRYLTRSLFRLMEATAATP